MALPEINSKNENSESQIYMSGSEVLNSNEFIDKSLTGIKNDSKLLISMQESWESRGGGVKGEASPDRVNHFANQP